jgi:D-alanyl-D-alanine-carboxypeptidase/D-alanyl-D-alanine-endopeptidase
LLDNARKLTEFHKEITLAEPVLERYVGEYRLAQAATLTVTREGKRMFAQLTGQPRFEVFAESERKFFLRVVPAQLVFGGEGDGKAGEVTLHQNGRQIVGKRTEP